ncbi:MAG: VWA domain-containing protein [candidate division KSB1 bacterium]|nr:VWA domain-containing protein [candidate division KSB1 bacterium]
MDRFADPQFLWLLILLPGMAYWHFRMQQRPGATIAYSNVETVRKTGLGQVGWVRHFLFGLRLGTVFLLILALARPRSERTEEEVHTEGIDIVIALDISGSMLAVDFKPKNRVEAAKEVASRFIDGRISDRIGLVVFAAESFTQCPPTLDYDVLKKFIQYVQVGQIRDGTAIGLGIANAASRLRYSTAKSKVIILLTDGRNNTGEIDPITAAQIAKALGIRVYTIGVGSLGNAMYPVDDPFFGRRYVSLPVEIDEELLKEIAAITGGRYFRATDTQALERIFQEIGQMEKTKIEVKHYVRYKELFRRFLFPAFAVLLLEIVLANTKFRKIP